MSMIEQMVEIRAWEEVKGLTKNSQCRLCKKQRETVQHLLTGCKMLASSEYLARHNRALMVMAVAWAKEKNLLDQNVKWHQEKWKREHVLGNSQASYYGTCVTSHFVITVSLCNTSFLHYLRKFKKKK